MRYREVQEWRGTADRGTDGVVVEDEHGVVSRRGGRGWGGNGSDIVIAAELGQPVYLHVTSK